MAPPDIPAVRLVNGPGNGQGFSAADWQMRILATFRMGHRTPEGPGWALGYRPSSNGSEWVWAAGEVCQTLDQFDPELLLPYGAHLRESQPAELAEAS